MNKIYFSEWLGWTFYSTQEYVDNGITIPIGTKFRLIARENGRYLYQYLYLMPIGLAY